MQASGVRGVAISGTVTAGIELCSIIYFLLAPPGRKKNDEDIKKTASGKELEENNLEESKHDDSFREDELMSSIHDGRLGEMRNKYSGSDEIIASKFTYLVSFIVTFNTIASG